MKLTEIARKLWKWELRIIIPELCFIVLMAAAFVFYARHDVYQPDETAMAAMGDIDDGVTVTEADRYYVFAPEEPRAGLIFYQGGKVEEIAYAPLMRMLAQRGVVCVLMKMPHNLAVLDEDRAHGISVIAPQIDWYIGGHSLGGVDAASYAKKHAHEYKGLLLLGSYVHCDCSGLDWKVLNVVGSVDGVLNRDRYEESKQLLPEKAKELIIPGGNHAGFGCYGEQKKDGKARITPEEQQRITADAFCEMIFGE